ncbi:MAG: beta-lactamase family protein [Chloroflexi bacterium]|nr:beta-lactamase family protein [Chloroflexota bacterium]
MRRIPIVITVLLLLAATSAPVLGQTPGPATLEARSSGDLAGVVPLPLTGERRAAFEASVADLMAKAGVPGGAVAVVQGGEIVYLDGFGVREMGGTEAVTLDTLLMIGSVTKPMTATMAATLVDDGRLRWDAPLANLLPGFATADPALTERLILADAFCACTGLPRQDLELIFSGAELTAEALVASVAGITPTTPFGEAFQYSNQMFSTGGYAAAAATPHESGLYDAYVAAMRDQVLAPIGMVRSTFDDTAVEADGDYALPHSRGVSGVYQPLSLPQEAAFVSPVAPAGGLWSSAREMARYLQTLLGYGVAPDGTRVVSAENLETTWTPRVASSPEDFPTPTLAAAYAGYGLGWVVGDYHGQRMLSHSGSTLGFEAQVAIWPEAQLGIVVLTNAQGAELSTQGVQFRLAELLFEQPAEIETLVSQGLDASAQRIVELRSRLGDQVDPTAVAPFLGRYDNPVLGEVSLVLHEGTLILDAGEVRSELRPQLDEQGRVVGYVATDPPMAPLPVMLRQEGGAPSLVVPNPAGGNGYVFAAASEATPSVPSPHDATPAAQVEHPVVGSWWSANDAPGPGVQTATAIFHADGTYLEVDPNIGVGVGAWTATGAWTADLIAVYQDIDPHPAVAAQGTVTVRKTVEVDETGDAFTGLLTVEVKIPDGTTVFTASYAGRGTRLQVEPIVPLGTPLAGTPVP